MGAAAFRCFSINAFDDFETQLDDIVSVQDDGSVQIPLDLLGHRATEGKRGGIFIKNGKKVVEL